VQRLVPIIISLALSLGAAPISAQQEMTDLQTQVFEVESAFARTMAERDHASFASFLAEEAVFFGEQSVLRGKQAIVDGWAPLYDGPQAPFSWEPEQVEVLASGTLAHSSGPVYDPQGNRVGTFNSIWRLEPNGEWRVVFDKGCSCRE